MCKEQKGEFPFRLFLKVFQRRINKAICIGAKDDRSHMNQYKGCQINRCWNEINKGERNSTNQGEFLFRHFKKECVSEKNKQGKICIGAKDDRSRMNPDKGCHINRCWNEINKGERNSTNKEDFPFCLYCISPASESLSSCPHIIRLIDKKITLILQRTMACASMFFVAA